MVVCLAIPSEGAPGSGGSGGGVVVVMAAAATAVAAAAGVDSEIAKAGAGRPHSHLARLSFFWFLVFLCILFVVSNDFWPC